MKAKNFLIILWQSIVGFATPWAWLLIYALIDGAVMKYQTGKNPDWDVGVIFAAVSFIVWLIAVLPGIVWSVKARKTGERKAFRAFWLCFLLFILLGIGSFLL